MDLPRGTGRDRWDGGPTTESPETGSPCYTSMGSDYDGRKVSTSLVPGTGVVRTTNCHRPKSTVTEEAEGIPWHRAGDPTFPSPAGTRRNGPSLRVGVVWTRVTPRKSSRVRRGRRARTLTQSNSEFSTEIRAWFSGSGRYGKALLSPRGRKPALGRRLSGQCPDALNSDSDLPSPGTHLAQRRTSRRTAEDAIDFGATLQCRC